jgi:hypothetical protein
MMTTTPPTRSRSRRAPAPRSCGYHRRPGRISRWKRTPRTRGSRACVPASPRFSAMLRAQAPSPWMRALDAACAGLVMVAGVVSWGVALAVLAF